MICHDLSSPFGLARSFDSMVPAGMVKVDLRQGQSSMPL